MRALVMALVGIVVIIVVAIFLPGSRSGGDSAGMKADSLIVMNEDSHGCESPSRFAEAVTHQSNKEVTAWRRIVDDRPTCFNERDTGAKQKWVILHINDTAMQIVRADDRAGRSYWTATRWGLLAQKRTEVRY